MSKSPAFQMYPKDFISSLDVQIMTTNEIGAYCLLLFNSWVQEEQCYLPNNDEILMRLCRMTKDQWAKSKDIILKKFKVEDGKIFNQRLLDELYKQQEYREKQRINGQKGGRPKNPNKTQTKPVGFSGETQTKPKKTSSSSFAFSFAYFIDEFNNITGRQFKGNDKVSKQLRARLKDGWVMDDILQAVKNCMADKYHKENPQYLTPEFITRADKLDKYFQVLTVQDKKPMDISNASKFATQ